jgi:hypothetical protein
MQKLIKAIKKYIKWLYPYGITVEIPRKKYEAKQNAITNYFLGLNRNEQDPEIVEIIDYFSKYRFSVYPYDFTRKYHADDIEVFYDASSKMFFVLHNEKKLYFPSNFNAETVRNYYNSLCIEQDEESPHRYETEDFIVKDGDIIADIGSAEGIWVLDNVEKAKKIYLFERDNDWIKALQKTFEPWKEKLVIVNKYVSNTTENGNISLDEFFKEETVNFIKADIEGAELKLLEGSKSLFSKAKNLKILLCAYHRQNDAKILKEILENNGFTTEYSKRYMIFMTDENLEEPYIRRGLIRAKKE